MVFKMADYIIFLPSHHCACVISAVIACPSVRPTVCLSQAGNVSKWLNLGSQKQCCTIVLGLLFYDAKDICKILMGSSPTGVPNAGGVAGR